jgi:hypothetical protein
VNLTTKQLKQIIQEELDLLQLPFEWASIKKEWESFYLKNMRSLLPKRLESALTDSGTSFLTYKAEDREETIKKYPQYFPPKKSRGWDAYGQVSMQVQAHGYPAKNEEGEWGYWDDTKEKPFEWTHEGVRNIWVRDQFAIIQNQINKAKKFYEQKIRPFQNELILQLREQMKYGFDSREAEDLMRIVNDFVKTEPPSFKWLHRKLEDSRFEVYDMSSQYAKSWNYVHYPSIKHFQKQLRRLKFDFDESIDLISRWKKRIDREKTR